MWIQAGRSWAPLGRDPQGTLAHRALCSMPVSLLLGAGADAGFPCLSLQENAIGDEGMAALSTALKVNTTLADLQ